MDEATAVLTSTLKIKPNTVVMQPTPLGDLRDDGKGRMLCSTGECVGAVDYEHGLIELGTIPQFDYPNLADKSELRKVRSIRAGRP